MVTISKSECNTLTISNGNEEAITYTIVKLSNQNLLEVLTIEVPLESISLEAGEDVEYEELEDGLYAVSIDGGNYEYFIMDCNIQACALDINMKFLCNTNSCEHMDYRKSQYNAIKFYSLFNLLYAKWNEWKIYRTIGSTTNETTASVDAIYVNDLISQLLKFCKSCNCGCGSSNSSTTYKSTDCGCS